MFLFLPFTKKIYNCFQLCYGKHCKMHFREEGPVNSAMDSICVDLGCTAQPAPAVWSNSRVEIRQAPFVFHFLFSFFLKNILYKNKDFFFLLIFIGTSHLPLDKIQLWNLGAVSSQNWNDSRLVFPGWIRFNNERNFIYSPGGKNGLRLDQEINLSNEKGGMNLYCPRNKLWPQLMRTRFYPLVWRGKINSLEAVLPLVSVLQATQRWYVYSNS